jgi:hypothetical protein
MTPALRPDRLMADPQPRRFSIMIAIPNLDGVMQR